MASLTLFAPQVAATQPAFIYEGSEKSAKVYINLFNYNTINDIGGILFSLIDPDLVSSWGNNSIIKKQSFDQMGILRYNFNMIGTDSHPIEDGVYCTLTNSQYIIEPTLTSFQNNKTYYRINNLWRDTNGFYIKLNFNTDNFNLLTVNKFYAMQVYSFDRSLIDDNVVYPTANWMNKYASKISEASQITLLRPILKPNIKINGMMGDSFEVYDFSTLKGNIFYSDDNKTEVLNSFYLDINGELGELYYGTDLSFSLRILNKYNHPGNLLNCIFYFTTANGYKGSKTFKVRILEPKTFTESFTEPCITSITFDSNSSIVSIVYNNISKNDFLERFSEEDNFQYGEKLDNLQFLEGNGLYQDLFINSEINYGYRIARLNDNGEKYVTPIRKIVEEDGKKSKSIEDIIISDETGLLVVRYNPTISNLKYVVQENITTTLGGKFPVIKRNGKAYYKQFNLSGDLFFSDIVNSDSGLSSNGIEMRANFFPSETELYVNNSNYYDLNYLKSNRQAETIAREIVVKMLTNGLPKLFRSEEEGNIIIYLSNITFTPNKTLGRHIYSFSATATEICECNLDNLKKYKLQSSDIFYKPFSTTLNTINDIVDNKTFYDGKVSFETI